MSHDSEKWYICYSEFDYYKEFRSHSLIDAAYDMLCWCIEEEYVKVGEDE